MVISYIQANNLSNFSLVGIPFIILIATGVTLLPVNSANTIVAFGTNTFTQRQFFIVNIINAVASLIMIVVFSATYWHWLGII
jgi:di/tricarboxylate transporter